MPIIDSSTKFVGINPNFPTAERKSAQNNAAQEVFTMQDIIDTISSTSGIQTFQQVSDTGGFDNFSTIRPGIAERFLGIRGLELVCVNDKMIQWADGREYYYINNGGIQPVVHCNSLNIDDIPDSTFDETIGFAVGSRYTVLNTGVTYVCTDATTDSAIWEDVVKYKVFSALITQSGTTNALSITSGATTAGVTYIIQSNLEANFKNAGAPNNEIGTFFIANGGTPDWGDDGELEYNEGAPIVNVLENNIGNIWFTYASTGTYYANSNELFTEGKTWGVANSVFDGVNFLNQSVLIDNSGVFGAMPLFQVGIKLQGGDDNGDGLLLNTPIEIRVYN
jgi:hypothetical protein